MKPHTPTRRRQLLDDTRRDLTQVDAILEAAMDLIHDSLNGHPRADPTGDAALHDTAAHRVATRAAA